MKKLLAFITATLLLCLCAFNVLATEESKPTVYITISDENGNPVLSYEEIEYFDWDEDGKYTINDVLAIAHMRKYSGGIDGYSSENSVYGLSLTKLWGAQTSAYGYYVNNASPSSLLDEIQPSDHIQAFVYTDTANFSDTFCFFDQIRTECAVNDSVTLTLSALSYDENWNTITVPVKNAEILVNGEPVGVYTDENGKATFVIKAGGKVLISAESDEMNLVPPICVADVNADIYVALTVLAVIAVIVVAVVTVFAVKKWTRTHRLRA